jgi:iron complex outermembrane receptor protein
MIKETVLARSIRLVGPFRASALLATSLLAPTQGFAQVPTAAAPATTEAAASATEQPAGPIQQVAVTGSRFGARIVKESPTPIDLISGADLARSGQVQLMQGLKTLVPSFSVSAPATAGALDFTSSPTLRGLGPGELLLLVNGKRRHSSGILNLFQQIGRGDVGYDFNAIPTAAIGHVEVLRDGASAQYGADAIAGVINLSLDRSIGASANVMTGATTEGDGKFFEVNGSVGVPLGEDGVLRTSVRYQDRGMSNRATPDTRQQYFGSNGTKTISGNYGSGTGLTPSNGVLDPREASANRNTFWFGEAPFISKAVFLNAEKPINSATTLYAFGGYSELDGDSPGFARRPGQDEVVRALFPDGYRPDLLTTLKNGSLVVGAKGDDLAGFNWDLSTSYGESGVDTIEANSNNVSLGALSPTRAYFGGTRFGQWTSNLDLSREIAMGDGAPLKVALGAEYRKEYYKINQGELASYQNGGVRIQDGPNAGAPATPGIQPTAGLSPGDATNQQRHSGAVYTEIERNMTQRLLVSGAARFERFSDFGNSETFKLATMYKVSEPLSLRGSVSTGFRAPNLAQSFSSTTSTTFISGNPVTLRLLPVSSPIAQLLGATDLRPEKSRNASVGAVWSRGAFTISGDVYRIGIDDRIALSSTFQDPRLTQLLASLGYPAIGAVSYMTNAIDTVTKGIDVTAGYRFRLDQYGTLNVTGAANYNKTDIGRIAPTPAPLAALGITTPLYDLTQQVRLTDASPKNKYVLGLMWKKGNLSINLNNTRYGEVSALAFSNLAPAQIAAVTPGYNTQLRPTATPSANSQVIQVFGAKIISDLNISYLMGKTHLSVGANNLFNVYPDKNMASTVASVAAGTNGSDNAGTMPYNYISPFGSVGRSVYVKLDYKF